MPRFAICVSVALGSDVKKARCVYLLMMRLLLIIFYLLKLNKRVLQLMGPCDGLMLGCTEATNQCTSPHFKDKLALQTKRLNAVLLQHPESSVEVFNLHLLQHTLSEFTAGDSRAVY